MNQHELNLENKVKLKNSIVLIDELVIIGKSGIKKFPTDHYDLITFTFINYLERFVYALDSINILLKTYEKNPNIETSIGLIIRTGLLDFMTISYLTAFYSEISPDDASKQEKFDSEFNTLMVDHLHNTFKYLKVCKDVGLIKDVERIETIKSLQHTYDFLFKVPVADFDNPGKALISQKIISPKDIFVKMISHPITKNYATVYDMYMYYSKYEHFGIVTHFLQRRGMNEDFNSLIAGLKYMVKGLGISMAFLTNQPDKLELEKIQFSEIESKFSEL